MKLGVAVVLAAGIGALANHYFESGNNTYTLYRSSPLDLHARIHVATFNTKEPDPNSNADMCSFVRGFLQNNPETKARWWCEPGTVHNNSK